VSHIGATCTIQGHMGAVCTIWEVRCVHRVGGSWDDANGQSPRLWERSVWVVCADAMVSLAGVCGVVSLYVLAVVAVGCMLGLAPDRYVHGVPTYLL
jgi:hypothetical protein